MTNAFVFKLFYDKYFKVKICKIFRHKSIKVGRSKAANSIFVRNSDQSLHCHKLEEQPLLPYDIIMPLAWI